MSKKSALVKGEREGELVRLKKTLRIQNEYIQKSKGLKKESSTTGFTSSVGD